MKSSSDQFVGVFDIGEAFCARIPFWWSRKCSQASDKFFKTSECKSLDLSGSCFNSDVCAGALRLHSPVGSIGRYSRDAGLPQALKVSHKWPTRLPDGSDFDGRFHVVPKLVGFDRRGHDWRRSHYLKPSVFTPRSAQKGSLLR